MGKILLWLQERVKLWTKPCGSYFVIRHDLLGKTVSFPYIEKKEKCKSIVSLTDFGLYSSKARLEIAGSYKDAR